MNTTYYEKEEQQMSRSEKIRLVKSAFAQNSNGRNAGNSSNRLGSTRGAYNNEIDRKSFQYGVTEGLENDFSLEEGKHHFGMLRMVIAGMLFFVLVLSFHFKLSYKEYDKAYIEQMLSDGSQWESLVNQVTQVMKQNVEQNP